MRGTKASLRSRQTSMVARPYSKKRRRVNFAASNSDTPSAKRKFSRIPRWVRRSRAMASALPTSEMPFKRGSGSHRAP
jgi:hypothetical protein